MSCPPGKVEDSRLSFGLCKIDGHCGGLQFCGSFLGHKSNRKRKLQSENDAKDFPPILYSSLHGKRSERWHNLRYPPISSFPRMPTPLRSIMVRILKPFGQNFAFLAPWRDIRLATYALRLTVSDSKPGTSNEDEKGIMRIEKRPQKGYNGTHYEFTTPNE